MSTTPKAQLVINTLEGRLAAAMKGTATRRSIQEADTKADALRRQYGTRTLLTASIDDQET